MEQIEEFPGIILDHKHTGRLSTAMTKPFEKVPMRLFLAGLFGCVSLIVVLVQPSLGGTVFLGSDDRFEREVLSTIRDGDLEDPIRIPGLFHLARTARY